MKIRGKTEALNDTELLTQRLAKRKLVNEQAARTNNDPGADTVKVGLSKAIAQLTSPRSERIAELKALVESGKYKIDNNKVADAVARTIDEEINLEKLFSV